MTATKPKSGVGRLQLLLVMLVFIGPLVIATAIYYGQRWQPAGRSNHGLLLEPIVNIRESLPASSLDILHLDNWLLLYADTNSCQESCRSALHKLQQTRQMLGNEMTRVVRVFLHGESAPDKVFIEKQHAGLIAIKNEGLSELLAEKRPDEPGPRNQGGIYLIDPLGNLVMYFSADTDLRDMLDDIKHLLQLSRIG